MNEQKKNSWYRDYFKITKDALGRFISNDTLTKSAALSFYTVFSLPPMLLIIFWTAGLVFEEESIRTAVFDELGELIGKEGSTQIMKSITNLKLQEPGFWKAFIGIAVVLFTSSTVFVAMQNALNSIFKIEIKRTAFQSILNLIHDRLVSLALLATIAFILTVSLVLSTLISSFGEIIEGWIGSYPQWFNLLDFVLLNIGMFTLLFAIMFRYLPDARIAWKETWFGALITALLFTVGKWLIAMLIGSSNAAGLYEAAGSLLVLMLWVYYASSIFLFGAILTDCRSKYLKEKYKL